MKPTAGVTSSWTLVLVLVLVLVPVPVLDAEPSCRPKELTALTQSLVEDSLTAFDEANGEHLGTWSPGFPELQVQESSAPQGSKVQCSLLFLSQGLEKVLEDQRDRLNPEDESLHRRLRSAASGAELLTACLGAVLGGRCSPRPGPPVMPRHAFDRKQWSHTLLQSAAQYLNWLRRHVEGGGQARGHGEGGGQARGQARGHGEGHGEGGAHGSKVMGQNQMEAQVVEGSGFLL